MKKLTIVAVFILATLSLEVSQSQEQQKAVMANNGGVTTLTKGTGTGFLSTILHGCFSSKVTTNTN